MVVLIRLFKQIWNERSCFNEIEYNTCWMSLAKKIIIGLISGVAIGLFVGEYTAFLSYIGDGFIALLQMTVLPYIMVSIIANLGRLTLSEGKEMIIKGLKVLGVLMLLGIVMLTLIPLTLPEWSAGAFFRHSIVEEKPPLDLLHLYIPSNPFEAMAKNVVPAVVLFSIFLGIGLSGIKHKELLLKNLDILGEGLNHINKMVVKLTPFGVFAIAAYNAGNMTVDEIQRLHAYIIIYSVAVILLGFYWLPLVINVTTGIHPRELFQQTKSTLLTIFATGKIIIVLPQLIDNVKNLIRSRNKDETEMEAKTEIVMPLAYPFPNLGTFVIFVFVPFIAWYLGNPLGLMQNVTFILATLLSSFVAPVTGIPFILNILSLPEDMFQLFVISSVYTDRIRVFLGAMHLVALTIITVQWSMGSVYVNWKKLTRGIILGIGLTVALLIVTRIYLKLTLGTSDQYGSFVNMDLSFKYSKEANYVEKEKLKFEDPLNRFSQLDIIRGRGVLRVGYHADGLPYSFRNENGKLVGFDIEMAYQLAKELGVGIEFVKISPNEVGYYLTNGMIDIVMSGVFITTNSIGSYTFSNTSINQTLAIIVPNEFRDNYTNSYKLAGSNQLTLGVVSNYYSQKVKQYIPHADIIELSSPRNYFKAEDGELDGLIYSAEAGAAWTIIYPNYSVVVPRPFIITVPMGYPMPMGDQKWKEFVNTWLEIKQKDGTVDLLFRYWVEGGGAEEKQPRWSVIKDVFHWVGQEKEMQSNEESGRVMLLEKKETNHEVPNPLHTIHPKSPAIAKKDSLKMEPAIVPSQRDSINP